MGKFTWMTKYFHYPLREDIFLSYSRLDAIQYTAALANNLGSKDLAVFIDQWETVPGVEIPPKILRALNRAAMLVVVGSPGAGISSAVNKEVKLFTETGRPIIPIDIGGALGSAKWYEYVAGAAASADTQENLRQATPDQAVTKRIADSFSFTRRNKRIRRTFLMAGIVLSALAGATWQQYNVAKRTLSDSYVKQSIADARNGVHDETRLYGAAALQLNAVPLEARLYGGELSRLPTLSAVSPSVGGAVKSIAFIPKTRLLAALTEDGKVKFFACRTVKTKDTWQLIQLPAEIPQGATALAVSPDGRRLVLTYANGSQGRVVVYDLSSLETARALDVRREIEVPELPDRVEVTSDSKFALASSFMKLFLMDIRETPKTGGFLSFYPKSRDGAREFRITSLKASMGQNSVAIGSQSGEVAVWQLPADDSKLQTANPFESRYKVFTNFTVDTMPTVSSLGMFPDRYDRKNRFFAVNGMDSELAHFGPDYGVDRIASGSTDQFFDATATPDGTYLVVAGSFLPPELDSRRKSNSGAILIFHNNFIYQVQKRIIYNGAVFRSVTASSDGEFFACGTDKGTVTLWRMGNHRGLYAEKFLHSKITQLQGADTLNWFCAIDESRRLTVWDNAGTESRPLLTLEGVIATSASGSGMKLTTLRRETPEMLCTEKWNLALATTEGNWAIRSDAEIAAVSEDGDLVALAAKGHMIIVRDRDGNENSIDFGRGDKDEEVKSLRFSPSGDYLTVCTNRRAFLIRRSTDSSGGVWASVLRLFRAVPGGSAEDSKDQIVYAVERPFCNSSFSPSERYCALYDSDKLTSIDLRSGTKKEVSVAASEVRFLLEERYIGILSTPWETALSIYELPDLSNRAERIDLGLPIGKPSLLAFSSETAFVGLLPSLHDEKGIAIYDISNVLRGLKATNKDGAAFLADFESLYGVQLRDGSISKEQHQ